MEELKILVVDDEARMRKLVKDFLVKSNYKVLEAADGEEAFETFVTNKDIALVILDIMMPKMNGKETCKEIRKLSNVPIILLTAKSEEQDELKGFEVGADEYITKPFSPKILVARIEALLRRSNKLSSDENIISGIIRFNKAEHSVYVNDNNIDLSHKEFELLEYFISNEKLALSRERILNSVWDYDYYGDARTVDTHVKKLRSKLGPAGNYIKTIWGTGYKYEVD